MFIASGMTVMVVVGGPHHPKLLLGGDLVNYQGLEVPQVLHQDLVHRRLGMVVAVVALLAASAARHAGRVHQLCLNLRHAASSRLGNCAWSSQREGYAHAARCMGQHG